MKKKQFKVGNIAKAKSLDGGCVYVSVNICGGKCSIECLLHGS